MRTRRLACAVGIILIITACASRRAVQPPSDPDTSSVLRLVGRYGLGHGCPVDGVILTAGHNIDPWSWAERSPYLGRLVSFSWEDSGGNSGYAHGAYVHPARDLGVLHVTNGTPAYYPLASEEPEIGDVLIWREYDRSAKRRAYHRKIQRARLVNSFAGNLIMEEPPHHGASGACVFDVAGHVVGIVTWQTPLESGERIGHAVSVVGAWWPEGINPAR